MSEEEKRKKEKIDKFSRMPILMAIQDCSLLSRFWFIHQTAACAEMRYWFWR